MKNLNEFNGKWNEITGKLKQKFSVLTYDDLLLDDDLMILEGKESEMLGRVQMKLGRTKEEICQIIFEL